METGRAVKDKFRVSTDLFSRLKVRKRRSSGRPS